MAIWKVTVESQDVEGVTDLSVMVAGDCFGELLGQVANVVAIDDASDPLEIVRDMVSMLNAGHVSYRFSELRDIVHDIEEVIGNK